MAIKAFISFVILISLSSCKKNYTCSCTTYLTYKTNSGNFNTQSFPGDKAEYKEKFTKKQAKSACEHMATAVQTNIKNSFTDNGRYFLQAGESIETKCDIIL
jgi:hypothetical protein